MNLELRLLDDESLLNNTKALAAEERSVTLRLLHHLQEVSRRRLFAYRGYSSIFEYVTRELGYSDSSAMRRISAMRLLTDIPEVEEKIRSGAISLSVAAQTQTLFQSEAKLNKPVELEEKKKILENLEFKSSREAERELVQHSSQPVSLQRPGRIRPVTSTHSEISFIADQALLDQLEKIKGLLGNKFPNLSLTELIEKMAEISLKSLLPKSPRASTKLMAEQASKAKGEQANKAMVHQPTKPMTEQPTKPMTEQPTKPMTEQPTKPMTEQPTKPMTEQSTKPMTEQSTKPMTEQSTKPIAEQLSKNFDVGNRMSTAVRSRYIPAAVKRLVYQRDHGKCQYRDPLTGRQCGSSHSIQYDHRHVPFALGGQQTPENLELKCAVHNRIMAINVFDQKMASFIKMD